MPITKIIIENFKGIRERVEVPIRPITLLFGANSAGKSTILHALLYLRELLERQNADADRVIGGGNDIYLGGFRQLVHGHDESQIVTVGIEFAVDADGLEPYPISRPVSQWTDDDEAPDPVWTDGVSGVTTVRVEVDAGISQTANRPEVLSYRVAINGEYFAEISGNREMRAVLREINVDHPIFAAQYSPDAFDEYSKNPITSSLETLFEGSKYLGPPSIYEGWIVLGHHVIPTWGQALEMDIDNDGEDGDAIGAPFAKFILSQLVVRPGELILEHLRTYRHLGPIRAVPDLSSIAQRSPNPDRWIDGMAAWDLLSKEAEGKGDLIRKVDTYLKNEDRLNLGYSLIARALRDLPVDSPMIKLLEKFAAAPEDFDADSKLKIAFDDLLSRAPKGRLILIDLRRDLEVNPSDIGAGVSQVIPVLVSVLETTSKITAIEQPELHLHPAVQCSLGDLFIQAANEADERLFLLESHSEHLLLRLMRRMRETASGAECAPDLRFSPDLLSLLFVETVDGQSQYRPIAIGDRGKLQDEWPGGFFEERLHELF